MLEIPFAHLQVLYLARPGAWIMMIFAIPASFLNFVCPQVLSPGPWSEDLLKTVGISIPLNPMKIPVYYWR